MRPPRLSTWIRALSACIQSATARHGKKDACMQSISRVFASACARILTKGSPLILTLSEDSAVLLLWRWLLSVRLHQARTDAQADTELDGRHVAVCRELP